ncbi:MAG: putative choline transporter, neither null mutation nor overexpression affects choline transport [Chaenotheca gracillima]|nr:MAG: putative choline transporter, neither null mutation nor overexpression affects choline transport [Chaenotheca gracillima]
MTGKKFDPNTDVPDLSGKVYVVTGGSAGIGYGIVAHLLQHNPSKIYLLSAKEEHADEATTALKEWGDVDAKVEWVKTDLADLKQTDEVARRLKGELTRLDGLICNAAIGVGKYWETKDGIDSHFQINHLSQSHLAVTLLPTLLKTPHSRLVLQSSALHAMPPGTTASTPPTRFASLEEINNDKVGPMHLYARTKLAQILWVRALVRRLSSDSGVQGLGLGVSGSKTDGDGVGKVWINATHPGGVKTDQQGQAVEAYGTLGKLGVKAVRPFMKDAVEEGCRPALFAATSERIVKEGVNGEYIVPDCKIASGSLSAEAKDDELGERLWSLTESILREKLGGLA